MQKPPQEPAPLGQKHVITPASAQRADETGVGEPSGYAIHNGTARSMEDVTVRGGTAPIIERGESDDDELLEESLDAIDTDSGVAPD